MMMSLAAAITVGVLSVFGKQPAVREPHPLQPGWKLVHFTESHRASLEKSLLGEMESGMDNSGVEWGKVKDPNFHGFTAADASARIAGMPAVAAVEGLADTIGEKWMAWKDQFQTAFANAHDEGHALQNYASAYAQIDARNRDSGGFELATNEVLPRASALARAPPPRARTPARDRAPAARAHPLVARARLMRLSGPSSRRTSLLSSSAWTT